MIATLLWAGIVNGVMIAVLAPSLWLVSRYIRSAPLRHALWLILLVKLVAPPLISIPLLARTAEPAVTIAFVGDAPPLAPAPLPQEALLSPVQSKEAEQRFAGWFNVTASLDWQGIGWTIAYVWLAGSAVWYSFAGVRLVRFARLAARSPLSSEAWHTDATRLAIRLGLRRVPQIRLVSGRVPPLLWAILRRPAILLPESLASQLSRQERWMLLTHELAHLARGDHWTRRLEIIVLGLYWWHPGVWLVCRQLRQAEEECCDAYVAWLWPQASHAYAHLLLNTLDFLATDAPVPIGVSGFASATTFRTRFAMILQGRSARRLPLRAKLALAAMALPLLLTSWAGGGESRAAAKRAPSSADKITAISAATDSATTNSVETDAEVEIIAAKPEEGAIDDQAAEFGLVSCDATELPLREVLKQISGGEEPTTFVVHLDDAAKCGVSLDRKLTLHVERISRQSALNLILKPLRMQHAWSDGRMHIVAQSGDPIGIWATQDHYIRDLTESRWSPDGRRGIDSLIVLLRTNVDPTSWKDGIYLDPARDHAEVGTISVAREGHYLRIVQSSRAQMEIAKILAHLRKNRQFLDQPRAEARIHRNRNRKSWRFAATPLEEVLKQLSAAYDENIVMDDSLLGAVETNRATPITWQANDARLEDVLPLLLAPLKLSYTFEDEVLKIVPHGYTIPVVTRTYDVYDLTNPTRRSSDERISADLRPLVNQIKSEVTPDSWKGYASISVFQDNLSVVISHNEAGHRAVHSYLKQLREAKFGGGESAK